MFGAAFLDELRTGACPQGARTLLLAHAAAVVEVRVPDDGILQDIDTPAELRRLRADESAA